MSLGVNPGRPTNFRSASLPAGAALLAATGEFVYGGPGTCGGVFRAETPFLIAGFNVFRLALLFVSVA